MKNELTSGEKLLSEVMIYSNAGAGVIHVRAKEIARAYKELRDGITRKGYECNTWNVVTGSHKMTLESVEATAIREGDSNPDFQGHIINLFMQTGDEDNEPKDQTFHIYVNADRWFEEPATEYVLQQLARDLPATLHRIIFITADNPLPESVSDLMVSVEMTTPTYKEIQASYTTLVGELDDEYLSTLKVSEDGVERICKAGSGLTFEEFETYLSEAFVRSMVDIQDRDVTHEDLLTYINKSKTFIVNKSDLLELYPAESMDNVGGLDNVKEWVAKRKGCYSEDAKDMGLEAPKGILLVGCPGAGKTLASASIASVLGTGIVRLDFGKMYQSLVGSSEERIRKALKQAEDLSPIVLFCDEVEKGLGSGGGDGGTSERVLATFLTWLQDCKKPVFTVFTANDVTKLRPELLRRGRLDQIFFVGLPTMTEKCEILKIHLKKRGYEETFTDEEIESLVGSFDGFVGAEIEAVVKEALIEMFSNGDKTLKVIDIVKASKTIVPLSKSHAKVVADIIAWGNTNAIPASKPEGITKSKKTRRSRHVSSIH